MCTGGQKRRVSKRGRWPIVRVSRSPPLSQLATTPVIPQQGGALMNPIVFALNRSTYRKVDAMVDAGGGGEEEGRVGSR